MGAIYSRLNEPLRSCSGSVTEIITGRKRKREEEDPESSDEISSALGKSLSTPIKKKLQTTAQYIYRTFYVEGQNSDISVMALGKMWHLHKIYMCQSPYFASMFNGSWREREQKFVAIEIIDPKITLESLNIVFGSFYLDEVILEPKTVVSVMATAALLQMEGLIDRCAEVMNSTINAETAITYYDAAIQYGTTEVKKNAFNWLLVNLLSFYSKHAKWLQLINADLLSELIDSPDLVVMQTEFALYVLLKVWMYMQVQANGVTDENQSEVVSQATTYFSGLKSETPFLFTARGRSFIKPFRKLRLQHLINHPVDIRIIIDDNIIPKDWLHDPIMTQWSSLIKIDHHEDSGPMECNEQVFYQTCLRCGRTLEDDGFQKWRWTGFNFGVDLVFISDIRALSIKRHHRTENERLLSLQSKRNVMLRVTIYSLNEQRQVTHSQTTGIKTIQLDRNEETRLMHLDTELKYPLLISVNLLVTTPDVPPPPPPLPPAISSQSNEASTNSAEAEISTIGIYKSVANNDHQNNSENDFSNNNDGIFLPAY